MGLKNNNSSEAAYDKAIRRTDEREANILNNSIVQMAQSAQIAQMSQAAQVAQSVIPTASAVKQMMAQQESFMQAVKPIQAAIKPMQNLTEALNGSLKIQNALQPYQGVMGQNALNLTSAATAFSQLAQVSSSTQALASAANTLAPVTNALAQAAPLSSITKSSDIVATAMKPFQDVNPVYSGFLAAFESAALTPELQWLNKQLTISKQTVDSGSLAIFDYIARFTSQWDKAFGFTNAFERSIAAQNLAFIKILPNYEKFNLPYGGKSVLKSLTKTAAEKVVQSDKLRFDPKEKDFYHEDTPESKLSGDQITVVASSLELFEEFSFDELISFESKLEENFAFAVRHPVGARIYEILKNWNSFVSFEDITYYHVRALKEGQRPYHDSEMLKAPTNVSAHGRYNEVGRSCYYIAEDRDGALKEIYKHSGGKKPRTQVIGLRPIKPVKLLDLSGNVKRVNRFIEHLRFTVENETGKTVHEYLLPNYVASCCKEIGIDGIRYRSAGYNCCVLWKDDYFEYVEGSRGVVEP